MCSQNAGRKMLRARQKLVHGNQPYHTSCLLLTQKKVLSNQSAHGSFHVKSSKVVNHDIMEFAHIL